ncbi:MAG: HTTM domain-containing protein [Bacteroidia bacterium]
MVMLFSTIRYMYMGWIDTQLVEPIIHFNYFGFDWIEPLSKLGMYTIFAVLAIACLGITLGLFYRLFTALFFLCFTYVELIDITYYLNHYYFVSLVSFLLILLPAHKSFSIDAKRNPKIQTDRVNRFFIDVIKLQIAIVYIYAGLAKINYDWLVEALPLAIWLPAKSSLPIIGFLFEYKATAYIFSWAGMFFDTFIVFALLYKRTRLLGFIAVVIFHTLTGILFQIGVFPLVMILGVTIFFSANWHEKLLKRIGLVLSFIQNLFRLYLSRNKFGTLLKDSVKSTLAWKKKVVNPDHFRGPGIGRFTLAKKLLLPFFILFFSFQLLFPWRHLLYDGNMFWTEEGYRFGWRVMLMEKAGTATFYVKDGENGREGSVRNSEFLNEHQEKQMAMQPDLILQYAHFLKDHFKAKGMNDPRVRAEVWVTLNANKAKLLIDPNVNLAQFEDNWRKKSWILPFNKAEMQ